MLNCSTVQPFKKQVIQLKTNQVALPQAEATYSRQTPLICLSALPGGSPAVSTGNGRLTVHRFVSM